MAAPPGAPPGAAAAAPRPGAEAEAPSAASGAPPGAAAAAPGSDPAALSALEALRLGAAQAYYSISRALRLDRVAALLARAALRPLDASPAALLGARHAAPPGGGEAERAAAELALLRHLGSLMWMSYRSGFPPLPPPACLTSDAGWGCALRSAQMLLAAALQRHALGAAWRWPPPAEPPGPAPPELAALLRLFWDSPDAEASPLSLHALCAAGAPAGVAPGRWSGPWAACAALAGAACAARCEERFGLRVAALASPGGGAPWLDSTRFDAWFVGEEAEAAAAVQGCEAAAKKEEHSSAPAAPPARGVLLLLPLTLGPGRLVEPPYLPLLRAALALPQAAGALGGRPGAALFLAGVQEESALALDPHMVQPAADDDAPATAESFRCDALRTAPLAALDPSLALAFYARGAAGWRGLCAGLAALEARAGGAPLASVRAGPEPPPREAAPGGGGVEEWEEEEAEEEEARGGAAGASGELVAAPGGGAAASPAVRAASARSGGSGWELL